MAMDLDEAIIRLEAANTGSELIEALDEITAEAEAYAYISQGIRRPAWETGFHNRKLRNIKACSNAGLFY